jgi:hypothetical protein
MKPPAACASISAPLARSEARWRAQTAARGFASVLSRDCWKTAIPLLSYHAQGHPLGEDPGSIEGLWQLAWPAAILSKQQEDGSWK